MPLILIAIVFLVAFGVSRWCLRRFEDAVLQGERQKSPLPMTGEEIAMEFLLSEEISDVQVLEHNGMVTDYFDPSRRRLFLRSEFKNGRHLAAWAVALHEAAHATQTGEALAELRWRRSCIHLTRYLPTLAGIVAVALMLLKVLAPRYAILAVAAVCGLALLLNFGSMAVERNANLRLRRFLDRRLADHPEARERLDALLSAVACREAGDLLRSPRYFFFSALPGSSKIRPR
jgi:Zn-dependent membrane protease YugP